MNEPKPCPFCASDVDWGIESCDDTLWAVFLCTECDAEVRFDLFFMQWAPTKMRGDFALEAFNRRADRNA